MGIFTSCCKPSSSETEVITPDAETRRRQLTAAAEQRRLETVNRGIKDPDKARRMQLRAEEIERRERELDGQGGAALKWQAN